jgi:hypothetical protein
METVIGLGGVGCRIADKFKAYSQYRVYKIDSEIQKDKDCLQIPKFSNPEEYETKDLKIANFLKNIKGGILFIVSGASITSGASLVILEKLNKNCKINILYVKPEVELLSETKFLQEKIAFNIFQEYARSNVFNRIFLASNDSLSSLVEDASVFDYYPRINETIVSAFHMINVYNHIQSVSDTFSDPVEFAKISTFGILNSKTGQEKLFFPLDFIRDARYYYGIPEKKLRNEKGLHKKIVDQVKKKTLSDTKVSYGIYSTDYDEDCGYILAHSTKIQNSSKKT